MRASPYWHHIQHWDVEKGTIGQKDKSRKLETFWQRQYGRIYLVCPHCRKILRVPKGFMNPDPDRRDDITCMVCTRCRVDYSYTLIGFARKPKTSPASS
jgi:hypothetical protein